MGTNQDIACAPIERSTPTTRCSWKVQYARHDMRNGTRPARRLQQKRQLLAHFLNIRLALLLHLPLRTFFSHLRVGSTSVQGWLISMFEEHSYMSEGHERLVRGLQMVWSF